MRSGGIYEMTTSTCDEDSIRTAVLMYQNGSSPSEILRFFALRDKSVTVPDLMQLLRRAFMLSYEDTQCIGGWWHDGTGELSDEKLNTFLLDAISRVLVSGRSR